MYVFKGLNISLQIIYVIKSFDNAVNITKLIEVYVLLVKVVMNLLVVIHYAENQSKIVKHTKIKLQIYAQSVKMVSN